MQDFEHPKDGYTFIVTYGRSGSTLLQNILNAIPGYQIRGENNNALLPLMQSVRMIKSSDPMRGMRVTGEVSSASHPWYGAELVDPDTYAKALAKLFTQEVLRPDPTTRVSGFKEIRFHSNPGLFASYLDFIADNFPNSRFIFNTRDHAAVAKSGWWAERPKEQVFETLKKAEALFEGYYKKHTDNAFMLHYDDYVKDPAYIKALYDFLGETYDAGRVRAVMENRLDHARRLPKAS